MEQKNTMLEQTIVEWARDNRYTINDMQLLDENVAQRRADFDLGIVPSETRLSLHGDIDKALEAEIEDLPDLKRTIYTPTGIVEYGCFIDRTGEDTQEAINNTEYPNELMFVRHGKRIPNWESDKIPQEEREDNSIISLNYNGYDQDDPSHKIITRDNFDIYINPKNLAGNSDPVSQALLALTQTNKSMRTGNPLLREQLPIQPEISLGFLPWGDELPRNAAAYRKILDYVSRFINGTE
jgi:hypothetical protein